MNKTVMHEHPLLAKSKEQTVTMTVEQLRLFASGDYPALTKDCVKKGQEFSGALLVFMAASRNNKLAEAAAEAGLLGKLKGGISERVYTYLWAHMHEDLIWLARQGPEWQKGIATGLPWKILLSERFHKPEWSSGMAYLLSSWEPGKLRTYPHALQYMVDPSELHVMEAACGKDAQYINPEQIDAMRPGASIWFEMRANLGIQETPNQSKQAFKNWWRRGAVESLPELDSNVFDSN